MKPEDILASDWLDVLYDGRNKDYGSYSLRRTYKWRFGLAVAITMLAFSAFCGGIFLNKVFMRYFKTTSFAVADVSLTDIRERQLPPPPVVVPPPPKLAPMKIEIKSFTVPRIVEQVDEKKQVKQQDELENTTIGHIDQAGIKAPDVVNPPKVDVGGKVVSAPAGDDNRVFTKVEIEAQFPGGDAGWNDYVRKAITAHIDELQDEGKSGTCEVQFIVDRDGAVSDVEALTMSGSKLAEIAVNAIRRGPHWTPAEQNGRMVKAFRRQRITFEMRND